MEEGIFGSIFPAIYQDLKNLVGKSFNVAGQQLEWKSAEQTYREKLTRQYGVTTILGKGEPIPLERVFTRVYIWDKPQAQRRFARGDMEARFLQGDAHYGLVEKDGVEVVKQFSKLFLLGKPGAGKTTFLRWLTTQNSQDYFNTQFLPIFISLKELADKYKKLPEERNSLLEQVIQEFEDCGFYEAETFVKTLLKHGKAFLLLDGLDEVQTETGQQERVIRDVIAFVNKYDQNRYLITCRIAAVTYRFERFKYVEISDFDDEQIDDYIKLYFSDDTARAEGCIAALHTPEQASLKDLARSPILLSLLCLNYEATNTFPLRRVEIYEEALNALLVKWDNSRSIVRDEPYKELTLGRKRQMYTRLAYDNFVKGNYFIPTNKMATQAEAFLVRIPGVEPHQINGDIILRAMETQHGILVERAHQIHAFSHLTFQEYFTAKHIIENEAKGTFNSLMFHLSDPRWREIFLLSASLPDEGDVFLSKMIETIAYQPNHNSSLSHMLRRFFIRSTSYSDKGNTAQGRWWGLYLSLTQVFVDNVFAGTRVQDLTRDLARDLVRVLSITRTLDLGYILEPIQPFAATLTLTIELARTIDNDYARIRARAQGLQLDLTAGLNLDCELAQTLADLNPSLGLDFVLIWLPVLRGNKAMELHAIGIRCAQILGDISLARKLDTLYIPTDDPSDKILRSFWQDVRKLSHTSRGLPEKVLIDEQEIVILNDYLYANELYLRCLELAAVNDRDAFKDMTLPIPGDE